jgi:hypothetical protein
VAAAQLCGSVTLNVLRAMNAHRLVLQGCWCCCSADADTLQGCSTHVCPCAAQLATGMYAPAGQQAYLQHLHDLCQLQLPHRQLAWCLWRQRLALLPAAQHALLQAAAPDADHHVSAAPRTCRHHNHTSELLHLTKELE